MAADTWSWVFSLARDEVPAPGFDSRSPDFPAMFTNHPESYLENFSPRGYPHGCVLDLAQRLRLESLKHLEEACVVLHGNALGATIDGYDALLQACRHQPELFKYRLHEPHWDLDADEACRLATLALDDFWKDENRMHPTYFLEESKTWMFVRHLRSNRDWLRKIHASGRCAVHVLLLH